MKEAAFPDYQVTVCKMERARSGEWRGGPDEGPPTGARETRSGNWLGRERKRVLGRADHASHHVRAVEFPLLWGQAGEDEVGLRLVPDE